MDEKKPWADEPTPKCEALVRRCASSMFWRAEARDLERRLRHAWKLVNSLRIDAMHAHDPAPEWQLDPELLEQMLGELEEVLSP